MEPDLDRQVRGILSFLDSTFKTFEDHQRGFLRAEQAAGSNGDARPGMSTSELEDATDGRLPMLLTKAERFPEHDTEHMAAFLLEWQMVGGSQPVRVVSLTPRDRLPALGRLAYDANRGGDTEPAIETP